MDGGVEDPVERWRAAFPRDLGSDVAAAAAASLPGGQITTHRSLFVGSVDSDRHPVGVAVAGEAVDIPYRFYSRALRPTEASAELTPRQRAVLGCMYSRHLDGYVRHRWAREIVRVAELWVAPFVIQLVGEFVIEIVEDLDEMTTGLDDPASDLASVYRPFVAENPGFLHLTGQRAASYRAEYSWRRHRDPRLDPARRVLGRLESLVHHEQRPGHPEG